MFNRKHTWFVLIVLLIGVLMLSGCGQTGETADQKEPEVANDSGSKSEDSIFYQPINARLASEELEGDYMTYWAEQFAKDMNEWSDGQFNLDVYPFGALGEVRDINEMAQLGVVEYVFSDFAWISSFVPEASVLGLHYIWPEQRIEEVMDWVVRNGEFMDILEESYRREGLVPLSVMFEGWQWITSNKRIETLEDMYGLDIRLMGSEMLQKQYLAYETSPTALAYGEIYSGLQTGLIDAQAQPVFGNVSMKFYEVQDYMTQIYAEPFVGIPTVNMQFFDSLPPEAQEKMRQWWVDAIIPSAEWINEVNEEGLEFLEDKLEIIRVEGGDLKEFKEKGVTAHKEYFELGGPNAEKIYNALKKDIENAKVELGIE